MRSEEFFAYRQGKIFTLGNFLDSWVRLEMVVKHVAAPIDIILFDLVNYAHINGLGLTLCPSNFNMSKGINCD